MACYINYKFSPRTYFFPTLVGSRFFFNPSHSTSWLWFPLPLLLERCLTRRRLFLAVYHFQLSQYPAGMRTQSHLGWVEVGSPSTHAQRCKMDTHTLKHKKPAIHSISFFFLLRPEFPWLIPAWCVAEDNLEPPILLALPKFWDHSLCRCKRFEVFHSS